MKKTIALLGILGLISLTTFAQVNVSTILKKDYSWDKFSDSWKLEKENDESRTFFVFNKDYTLVKHTTESSTRAYIIKSKKHEKDPLKNQYTYLIVSDTGKEFMMYFDVKNKNIRVVDKKKHAIRYTIKGIWED
jgi:hypothetical protein